MEASKDQSPARPVVAGASKLRYPLRSASRPKEMMVDASGSSASKRGRPPSSVSKSVNVLDLSGKDKSAKPPRRLSVPSKSNASPRAAVLGNITPISETRMKSSRNQGKSDTPVSDASRSSARRKFCVLSSVSYWLTQIRLSEAASKHSISLGFFKLALESGCEPLQRLQDELKTYACRHNLVEELGQPAKDLLQSYNILEDLEQLKISETSQLPDEGPQNLADGAIATSGNLKPKTLNSDSTATCSAQKKQHAAKNRVSPNKRPTGLGNNIQKRPQKASKGELYKAKIKSSTEKPTTDKVNLVDTVAQEEMLALLEDKENMDAVLTEDTCFEEGIQIS